MAYYDFSGAFNNLNSAIDGIGKRIQERRDTDALLAAYDAQQGQPGQMPSQPVAPRPSPLLSLGRGDDYFGRTASAESSNDPNARNPKSSATGLHQFLKGTWAGLMKSNPELGLTEDGRTDPEQSGRAMRAFTAQNADVLRATNIEPSDRNLYMAHFLGAGAAPNFINAVQQDPSVPATSLVRPEVVAANRAVFLNRDGTPKTAGEVFERMTARFGGGSTAIAALGSGQGAPVQVAQAGGDTRADLPPQGADAGLVQAQGFAIPGAQPATRQNSGPMVRALLANPGTRDIGKALWQQAMTGRQFGFQVVGDQLYRTDPRTGAVEPVGVTNPKAQLEMEATRADIALKNKQLNATKDRQSVKGEDGALYDFDPQTGKYTRQIEGGPKSEDVTSLRKEVQNLPSYKNIAQAAPIYKSMLETAGRDSKASDLNLVYGLGKIMDPTSVVREGEMVMVRNSAGLSENLIGAINSLNGGAALTPQTRQALMQEAHSRMQSYKDMFDQDSTQYDGIIQRRGMNRADVLPSFGEFKAYERPKKGTGGTPEQASGQPTPVKPGSIPVPPIAVKALRDNPDRAAEFDAKYGAGMSERILRGE